MNKKIEIFARHCNFSKNSINKDKPKWFDKEKLYLGFTNTLDLNTSNLTILFDGDVSTHFLKNEKRFPIIQNKSGNDAKSFLFLLDYVYNNKLNDDTIVYFVEDDYLHHKDWQRILIDGIENINAEYFTLYDHRDEYTEPMYDDLMCKLYFSKLSHWKTIPATTNTYSMKYSTFKKHIDIHKKYCNLNDGITHDYDKFIELWNIGSNLVSSVPGYSTHCESKWMSPLMDWEKIFNENLQIS